MSYCEETEVKRAWADITDSEIGTERLADAIAYADGIIDSSLCDRYDVPFSTTPAIIKGLSINISVYYCKLWKDPRLITEEDDKRYKKDEQLLEKLQNGKISISGVSQKQLCKSNREDYTPVFDERDMTTAEIDEDLEDDLEDLRD